MIIKLLFALCPVGVTLLLSEYLWRKKILKGERARKFIHILSGVWIAFWPFYIPLDGIFVLGAAMCTLLVYSRLTNLFHAIYDVRRRTYGDIFYALGFMACAFFGREDWIFTVSVLLLALADGGAAVVGRFWGRSNSYLVFGSKQLRKSISGTLAFLIFAVLSVGIGWLIGGDAILSKHIVLVFIWLPLVAALLENTMPFGLDNIATPLLATLLLNSLIS
jgi:dolichol kinase